MQGFLVILLCSHFFVLPQAAAVTYHTNGVSTIAAPESSNPKSRVFSHDIVYDSGSRAYFLVYIEEEQVTPTTTLTSLWGRVISANGLSSGSPIPILLANQTSCKKSNPSVAFNSIAQEYLVVYECDVGNVTADVDIYGSQVVSSGSTLRALPPFVIGSTPENQLNPHCVYNSKQHNYAVAWEEHLSNGNTSIAFRRLNDTTFVGSTTLFTGPHGHSFWPHVLCYPDGHYLVFFGSDYNGHKQIFASSLKASSGGPSRRSWQDEIIPVSYKLVASIEEFINNKTTHAQSYFPHASIFNVSLAVVVWEVVGSGGNKTTVLARATDSTGAVKTNFVDLGSTTSAASQFPVVVSNHNNQSLVVFDVGAGRDAQGQTVNSSISAIVLSSTLKVSTTFTSLNSAQFSKNEHFPAVAYDSSLNNFFATWVHNNKTSQGDPSLFTRNSDEKREKTVMRDSKATRELYYRPSYELRSDPSKVYLFEADEWETQQTQQTQPQQTQHEGDERALAMDIEPSYVFGMALTPTVAAANYVPDSWDKGKFFLSIILPLMALPLVALIFLGMMLLYKFYAAEYVKEATAALKQKVPILSKA